MTSHYRVGDGTRRLDCNTITIFKWTRYAESAIIPPNKHGKVQVLMLVVSARSGFRVESVHIDELASKHVTNNLDLGNS